MTTTYTIAIADTVVAPMGTMQPHPRNINQGDIGEICESLKTHGQYRAIGVSTASGNIVYGNHTYLAAEALGWTSISAHLLHDLTPEQELRILLADNEYARKATYDEISLSEMLIELQATPRQLEGTGFDGDRLDEIVADLTPFTPDTELECPECGYTFNRKDT